MTRLDRRAWRTLYERDIDLLLLDLLHSSESFRHRFLSTAFPSFIPYLAEFEFRGAWHSVIDALGHESDLEADWWSSEYGGITLLIEDKIDAPCQPDQAIRYAQRAERYQQEGSAQVTRTILVSPESYPLRHKEDTSPFEVHVSLEQIANWLNDSELGTRATYLSGLIDHALSRWTRFDSTNGDNRRGRQFPEIYSILADELAHSQHDLWISNSPTSRNSWVYLQSSRRERNVKMRYRFLDQWAELVLPRQFYEEDDVQSKLAKNPLPGASVSGRGKTELAVWISTPELDLESDAAAQLPHMRAAIATLGALQNWYERSFLEI